jgi:DNA-binding transcriptional LysR family regulator
MGGVELRQLQYFVAVAEHLHFGKAAEALAIGQPAVSQQVARLERTLGTTLLDRSPRTVRLTEAGSRFLPEARKVLAALDHACEAVGATPGGHRLRIGTCSGLGTRLDTFLSALAGPPSGRTVELASHSTRSRLERVRAGQLDAAFVRGRESMPGVQLVEVWRDPLTVVVPAGHPVAASRTVSLSDLGELPLRIVPRRTNPALVDAVLQRCADEGVHPRRIDFDGAPVDVLLAAVASGPPSWAVIFASHAVMLQSHRVAFLDPEPELTVTTSLALPEHLTSREAAPLIDACLVAADVA